MTRDDWARFCGISLVLLAAATGCKPKIGDDCDTSANCSATGDRLCDITQPGGYCTLFNCEPGTCPDEAVCIGYGNSPSAVASCVDRQGGQRLQRTFCLRSCDSNGDCRSGYRCEDLGRDNPWDAIVVEKGRSGKVCVVPFKSLEVKESDGGAAVCGTPPDAGASDAASQDATTDADSAVSADASDGDAETDSAAVTDADAEAASD